MEIKIEKRFRSVETRLKIVESGYKDYKQFKPTILGRLKEIEGVTKEYCRFKDTVFQMVNDLSNAIEQLSGISLAFNTNISRHHAAYGSR